MTDDVAKAALAYHGNPYNCVQAVVRAILEHKGLYFDEAFHMATPFYGGILRTGQQCGAITGGMLALGVIIGKTAEDFKDLTKETIRLSSQLISKLTE